MIEKILQEISDMETRLKEITDTNDEMISKKIIGITEIIDKFLKEMSLPEETKNEFSNNFSKNWREVDLSLRNTNKTLLKKVREILMPVRQLLSSISLDEENKAKDSVELICGRGEEIIEKIQKEAGEMTDSWTNELENFFIDSENELKIDLSKFAGDHGINFNPESFP